MARTKSYASPIAAAVHEAMSDAYEAGAVPLTTLRKFDALCLTPVEPLAPADIKRLRERELASQAVFARYLNVTPGLVSQWERGEKRPRGASLKLLTLVKEKGLAAVA
jgi:putative transcriptional regulator